VTAIPKAIAILDVVTCLPTPVAHLAVVFAPCVDGPIANGDLCLVASLAFKIRGFMHVTVNATANTSYSVSGGKTV